jgi:hypothetical protein
MMRSNQSSLHIYISWRESRPSVDPRAFMQHIQTGSLTRRVPSCAIRGPRPLEVTCSFLGTKTKVKVMLWPAVSGPVCLDAKPPSGAEDQICISASCRFVDMGAFSGERTLRWFVIYAGPQRLNIRKIHGLSLIFIDFYVTALTPRLISSETSLQVSDNIMLFVLCRIYTGIINKDT